MNRHRVLDSNALRVQANVSEDKRHLPDRLHDPVVGEEAKKFHDTPMLVLKDHRK